MQYVFEELSIEEIPAIKLPAEPAPAIPDVVFEDISTNDLKPCVENATRQRKKQEVLLALKRIILEHWLETNVN